MLLAVSSIYFSISEKASHSSCASARAKQSGKGKPLSCLFLLAHSARGDEALLRRMRAYPNFYSRPSARGDALRELPKAEQEDFYSRPSARGDGAGAAWAVGANYFYSRPSARGDSPPSLLQLFHVNFYSRPSARGDDHSYSQGLQRF